MFDPITYLKTMQNLKIPITPLAEACIMGSIDKVRLLLDDKNNDMYHIDIHGQDAFRMACIFQHIDIVRELLFQYDYQISDINFNFFVERAEHFTEILDLIDVQNTHKKLNNSICSGKYSVIKL